MKLITQLENKMKLKDLILEIDGYADKRVVGLANVKPGDAIEIGFEGTRSKARSKIVKVVANDRLMDAEGNIFNRNGIIFRKRGSWVKHAGANSKIISARQITKKEYIDSIMSFVSKQLKEFDWAKLPPETLIEVGKLIHIGFPQLEKIK